MFSIPKGCDYYRNEEFPIFKNPEGVIFHFFYFKLSVEFLMQIFILPPRHKDTKALSNFSFVLKLSVFVPEALGFVAISFSTIMNDELKRSLCKC